MSDQVLYRKYRPGKWGEVIGQDHIVEPLKNSVESGVVAHAYLFAGPRGTGKTSIARILAKSVGTSDKDLYEIDAASNRGIDEIRMLRDAVGTLPFESEYKVYIIDEVHMLTKEAFNALLKTLEEPPKHVIFILATTDDHKVPDTVVSRCQVYQFKAPSVGELAKHIIKVGKKEEIEIDKDAANLIAMVGDGSFRDTLGVLQKVLNVSGGKAITGELVQSVTDAPPISLAQDLVLAIVNSDLPASLAVVNKAVNDDLDISFLHKLVLRTLRLALLLAVAPEMEKTLLAEVGSDEAKFLQSLDKTKVTKIAPQALRELLPITYTIKGNFLPQLPFELALVQILTVYNK